MSNLLNRVVSESSTFQTLQRLKHDTTRIRESLTGGYQNTSQRLMELKHDNVYMRKLLSWFDQRTDESNDSLLDDEDDIGLHSSSVLSQQQLDDITQSQRNEMYRVGKKQVEAKLHTTAEIIQVIDDRSTEIITSLQHSTSYISSIMSKLDRLLEIHMTAAEKARRNEQTIYDAKGRLTIKSVFDHLRNVSKSDTQSTTKRAMQLLKLDQLDSKLNDTILNFQNNLVTSILNIPFIKKNLNLNSNRQTDYSSYIENGYNKERALFDNMTRHSIVSVIPSYLKIITRETTNTMYHVSAYGELTTEKPRGFVGLIHNMFDIPALSEQRTNLLTAHSNNLDKTISTADVKEIQRIFISQYVYYMYTRGIEILDPKVFNNGGLISVRNHILQVLLKSKKYDTKKWTTLLTALQVQLQLDEKFRKSMARLINQCAAQLHQSARKYAITSDGSEDMQFTQDMFDQVVLERLKHETSEFEYAGKTLKQLVDEGVIKRSTLTKDQMERYNEPITSFVDMEYKLRAAGIESTKETYENVYQEKLKYLSAIFGRLNMGLNTYFQNGSMKRMNPLQVTMESPKQNGETSSVIPEKEVYESSNKNPSSSPITIDDILKMIPSGILDKVSSVAGKISDALNPDRMKQKEVLAGMKAVAQDGEMSEQDSGDLLSRLSKITNDDIRSRLQGMITGFKDRMKKVSAQKTIFGKALMLVWTFGKPMISKIFKNTRKLTMSIGKKFTPFVIKSLNKSLFNVSTGAASALAGVRGLKNNVKSVGKGIVDIKNNLVKAYQYRQKSKEIRNIDKTRQKERWAQYDRNLELIRKQQKIIEEHNKRVAQQQKEEDEASRVERMQEKLSQRGPSKLFDKLKNSKFGQGFADAFKRKNKIASKTLEDYNSNDIEKLLSKQTKGFSFLTFIKSLLDNIGETVKDWFHNLHDKLSPEKREERKKKRQEERERLKKKGAAYNFGKIVGGIANILSAIMASIASAVAVLKGATKLMDMIESILTKSLKPLNKVFFTVIKLIKPILTTIQKMLTTIVQAITEIVKSIVGLIQPMLELINPIIERIMETLSPILEMLSSMISLLVIPLTALLKIYIIPRIKFIANIIQIQAGFLQVSFGLILTLLGGIMTAVGYIGKLFGARSLIDQGKQLMETGTTMITGGINNVVTGMKNQVFLINQTIKDAVELVVPASANDESSNQKSKQSESTQYVMHGSVMDGLTGSGDSPIEFSDSVQDALSTLREIVGGIVNIFTGDDSVSAAIKDEDEKNAYQQSQIDAEAQLSEEERQQVDSKAFELFKNENPQQDEESDKDYKKRYESKKARYWTMAASSILRDKVKSSPGGSDDAFTKMLNESVGDSGFLSGFADTFGDIDSQVQQGSGIQQFADTVGSSRGGTYTEGYDKEDLVRSIATVYNAYGKIDPAGHYNYGTTKTISLNGHQRNLRPDCSGIVSMAITEMGYQLKNAEPNGSVRSPVFAGQNAFILDPKTGQASPDWAYLDFDVNDLQYGDITAVNGHVSMPLIDLEYNKKTHGFDGGSGAGSISKGTGIPDSIKAATAYLTGDKNWQSYLHTAMGGGKDDPYKSPTRIIRYVGKPITRYIGSNAENVNMNERQIFQYLVHTLGMSEIGAAGIMGILYHESGMKSNNLEDEYNKPTFFGMSDEEYTRAVDTGKESEQQFITGRKYRRYSSQTPGEAVGYGLSQFTSSNLKRDLYARTVKRGKSIADVPSQLDLLTSQLRGAKYKGTSLFNAISRASSPTEANKYFFWRFAAGVDFNSDAEVLKRYSWMSQTDINKRHQKAEDYYYALHGSGDVSSMDGGQPIIVNDFMNMQYSLLDHLDSILYATYDVESQPIRDLVESIFDELPEYLEDDDDEFIEAFASVV